MDELRLAFRRLTHHRGTTIASILTLACSIGAAAATWSLFSAVLLHPLPIRDPARVFVVGQSRDMRGMPAVSEAHVYSAVQLVRETGAFAHVAAGGIGAGSLLVETSGRRVPTNVYFCTFDWFDLLGVPMALGRPFREVEDRRGAPPVAIISDGYWRAAFHADPQILGRALNVAGTDVAIVGVAPAKFRGLSLAYAPDIYLPFHVVADATKSPMNFFAEANRSYSPTAWITIVGRLPPDSNADRALQQLRVLDDEGGRAPRHHVLVPVNTAALPSSARFNVAQFTQLLATTVGLLFAIGCTTVGMLLLVRTEARREEFAMCLALGASRARLARGVVLEGGLISVAAAILALPVALWLFSLVRAFQLPGSVSIDRLALSIDWSVVLASAASAVFATLLIATVAGVFGFSANVADALRTRAGATPRLTRRRTRTLLATAEIAVALLLLSGAGLFLRSVSAALGLNAALDADRIVTGSVGLQPYGYTSITAERFGAELAARLRGNPAIRSFALNEFQAGMGAAGQLIIDGQPRQFPTMVSFVSVDEHYFATMRLPVTSGRGFTSTDTASAPPVVIVSESFGRMIANGGNPLGRRIRDASYRPPAQPLMREIVGVVPDVVANVAIEEPLVLYFPMAQTNRSTFVQWSARAEGTAASAIREILSAIKQIDSQVTPSQMLTLRDQLGRQMSAQRFGGIVLTALGVIAILLTALGTYVLSETMSAMRLREMGIRAAIGASGPQLAGIVLLETLRLVGIGLLVGLFLAWLGGGTIRAFLFKVQPLDALTLSSVAALILVLALAVSLKPALRAARVDLASVLRET
jgi:predicted permease